MTDNFIASYSLYCSHITIAASHLLSFMGEIFISYYSKYVKPLNPFSVKYLIHLGLLIRSYTPHYILVFNSNFNATIRLLKCSTTVRPPITVYALTSAQHIKIHSHNPNVTYRCPYQSFYPYFRRSTCSPTHHFLIHPHFHSFSPSPIYQPIQPSSQFAYMSVRPRSIDPFFALVIQPST